MTATPNTTFHKELRNVIDEYVHGVYDCSQTFPKDELFEVFDPFTVSSKTKTSAGGRGIGLALSKKVIEAHNGQIWAKQNQDKGVTVAFTLTIND